MHLTIVIPAYNEEEAIASIIKRCLKAERKIIDTSPVDSVEVIVVSDGSTDRTAEIARGFPQARLIEFPENRGYGAAIKRGFAEGTGDLLSFLDADGTCDPEFFGPLCDRLIAERADIALGSRMGPNSCMPRTRRIGNTLFAWLLGALSNRAVSDTASGMRVIRREVLAELYPLPDGLNFTPAMSARALLDERLKIIELPMSYEERVGRSKLSVVHDGVRFLSTIVETALLWRPSRLFATGGVLFLLAALLLSMGPIELYLRQRIVRDGMVYRLLFCSLLGTLSVMLLSLSVVSERLSRLLLGRSAPETFVESVLAKVFSLRGTLAGGSALMTFALFLVGPGLFEYALTFHVTIHWSRIALASMAAFCTGQLVVSAMLLHMANRCMQRWRETERNRAAAVHDRTDAPHEAASPKTPEPVLQEDVAAEHAPV